MERLELDFPEAYSFSTEMSVRVGDLNYGGHLGNDAVLSLVHEARIRFLKDLGYSELDVGGPGLIMANAAVRYRAEGEIGDPLRIRMTAANVESSSFDLFARVENRNTALAGRIQIHLIGADAETAHTNQFVGGGKNVFG